LNLRRLFYLEKYDLKFSEKLMLNAVTFQCRKVIHIQITQFIHNLFNFLQKPLQTEAAFVFYGHLIYICGSCWLKQ
jgi:hypothetical protein